LSQLPAVRAVLLYLGLIGLLGCAPNFCFHRNFVLESRFTLCKLGALNMELLLFFRKNIQKLDKNQNKILLFS